MSGVALIYPLNLHRTHTFLAKQNSRKEKMSLLKIGVLLHSRLVMSISSILNAYRNNFLRQRYGNHRDGLYCYQSLITVPRLSFNNFCFFVPSYADLTKRFSASLSTECQDGTHACVDQASCLQSTKSNGYLCQCPAGQIGDGFQLAVGGDGCSDDCQLFQGKDIALH